jgi:hypothetical protein
MGIRNFEPMSFLITLKEITFFFYRSTRLDIKCSTYSYLLEMGTIFVLYSISYSSHCLFTDLFSALDAHFKPLSSDSLNLNTLTNWSYHTNIIVPSNITLSIITNYQLPGLAAAVSGTAVAAKTATRSR